MPEIIKTVEQIERERVTRRQALRKFGFGAGLSAFMLLGVDDLARMVGVKMQQMAGDNQVAETVAQEFKNAGIAFAGSPSQPPPAPCGPSGCWGCGGGTTSAYCCGERDTPLEQMQCCANTGQHNDNAYCMQCCQELAQAGYISMSACESLCPS